MLDVTILITAVTALVSVAKIAGLNKKYAPLLAVVLGVAAYNVVNGLDWVNTFQGILVGLTASGLYSGWIKPVVNK